MAEDIYRFTRMRETTITQGTTCCLHLRFHSGMIYIRPVRLILLCDFVAGSSITMWSELVERSNRALDNNISCLRPPLLPRIALALLVLMFRSNPWIFSSDP